MVLVVEVVEGRCGSVNYLALPPLGELRELRALCVRRANSFVWAVDVEHGFSQISHSWSLCFLCVLRLMFVRWTYKQHRWTSLRKSRPGPRSRRRSSRQARPRPTPRASRLVPGAWCLALLKWRAGGVPFLSFSDVNSLFCFVCGKLGFIQVVSRLLLLGSLGLD